VVGGADVGFYDREALAALVDAREILREAGQQEGDAAVVEAGDGAGFRRAVRLTSLWCVVFSAGVSALALAGGGAFIDTVSTSPAVREAARAFLPFAALTPICGAMAFEFDGVFIGTTWTRDMRNLMLAALGLYLALFVALRPLGNAGLWTALLGLLLARGALQGWRYRALADATFPRERGGGATAGAVG